MILAGMNVNPRDKNITNINASIYYSNYFTILVYTNGCRLVFINPLLLLPYFYNISLDNKFYATKGEKTAVLLYDILKLYQSLTYSSIK